VVGALSSGKFGAPQHRPGSRKAVAAENGANASEIALLKRIADNDRTAFWLLWQLHAAYLLALCLRLKRGNRDEAEDILSEVCLRLAVEMPRHAGNIRSARAWFARILANAIVDHYRNHYRHIVAVGSAEEVAKAAGPDFPSSMSPEEELILRQTLSATIDGFEQLPQRLRIVVCKRFFEENSYGEIAASLHISEALVRKRVQEARAILRKLRTAS